MTTTLTPKFKVGDYVRRDPHDLPARIEAVKVAYMFDTLTMGRITRVEESLIAVTTEEQAALSNAHAEKLKKNMLVAIAEYEAFLKN